MNKIKRHFYNGEHYIINHQTRTVTLKPEFKQKLTDKKLWKKFGFKKISGSSIGDVLEVSQSSSLFQVFCRLVWIGLPILDRKYVDASIAIESKVIESIEETINEKIKTFDPYKYQFDFFKGKDDILGGLPVGYIESKNTLLEIKTVGYENLEKWRQYGVPTEYLKQAELYAYLMSTSKYAIVATFLKPEDYINPHSFPIRERMVKTWSHEVDLPQVEKNIKKTKEWYKKVTLSGVSPVWDEKKDVDLVKWLECKNQADVDKLLDTWKNEGKYIE